MEAIKVLAQAIPQVVLRQGDVSMLLALQPGAEGFVILHGHEDTHYSLDVFSVPVPELEEVDQHEEAIYGLVRLIFATRPNEVLVYFRRHEWRDFRPPIYWGEQVAGALESRPLLNTFLRVGHGRVQLYKLLGTGTESDGVVRWPFDIIPDDDLGPALDHLHARRQAFAKEFAGLRPD